MPNVEFRVVRWANEIGPPELAKTLVFLVSNNWNDAGWETLFAVHIVSASGHFNLGNAKILHVVPGTEGPVPRTVERLEPKFTELPSHDFCSLGQSVDYYTWLKARGEEGLAILRGLADVCFLASDARERWFAYAAFGESLLRFSDAQKALREAPDIIAGVRATSKDQSFSYSVKVTGATEPHEFCFAFDGAAAPSSRLNVLIGINGVGKSTVLSQLAEDLSTGMDRKGGHAFPRPPERQFSRQILVSTTPFDLSRRPALGNASSYRFVGPRWKFDELHSRVKGTVSSPTDKPWITTLAALFPDPADLLDHLSAEVLPPSERHLESLTIP